MNPIGTKEDSSKEITTDCGCTYRCEPYFGDRKRSRKMGKFGSQPAIPLGYFWFRIKSCDAHKGQLKKPTTLVEKWLLLPSEKLSTSINQHIKSLPSEKKTEFIKKLKLSLHYKTLLSHMICNLYWFYLFWDHELPSHLVKFYENMNKELTNIGKEKL